MTKLAIHTLKPSKGSRHTAKKRGRGNASGHGNYSGHGGKGQTARSGGSRGLKLKGFKRLLQSAPKLRGFTSIATRPTEVSLSDLEKNFAANEVVNVKTLLEKNMIGHSAKMAKVLSTGKLTKKLTVEGLKITARAKEAIEKAGGEVK
ncbi:MAG: 50S ribosomal protein L15 [uncultured bacterium]|nr:MAG: 50S ribosomal protein L15 [uncultured bacterium]